MKGLTEDYTYLCSRKISHVENVTFTVSPCMLLELFLNMELSPVKCGNCFSPCKVHGDILQDWELIPGPSSL